MIGGMIDNPNLGLAAIDQASEVTRVQPKCGEDTFRVRREAVARRRQERPGLPGDEFPFAVPDLNESETQTK